MSKPLFEFRLRPLEEIQPWGTAADPNLHWFGLSDGCYWLNVGQHMLLEYSQQFQDEAGATRYCDYQIVRLHEDVLDMLPHVLRPVPPELREFIALKTESQVGYWDAWTSLDDRLIDAETHFDLLDNAGTWLGERRLDSLYLSPSARIWMWSDEQEVHIQWDNRDVHSHGVPVWSASCGSFSLSRVDFVNEVKAFHWRFMQQMAERVASILSNGAPPGVRIDRSALWQDQQRRASLSEQSFQPLADATPWLVVSAAVRQLEELRKAALS
ncbi:DUF5984 family protein [Roseateles sp.]|uniref:DUF5984 family protein n=1 Tax=Roseateles sp. TaxID=1971397 RepID=UPI0032664B86